MNAIYDVTVTREGRYWVAVVDGLAGGATETRSLPLLETEVRDLISGLTDADPDELDLRWSFRDALPAEAVSAVDELDRMRQRMREAEREYAAAQGVAASRLAAAGVSVRDAASLLGVSAARVSQLGSHRAAAV